MADEMQETDSKKDVPEGPTDNDRFWLTAALVTFVFAVVAFGFAAVWTFSEEGQAAVFRSQAFAPFGVALGAVVTFFTVVWRGILTTKQLDLQAAQLKQQVDQLNQVIRQNDAKEDETLVKLLQDGAKLIAEEKDAQIMAGVTSLDALISNDQKRLYSVQAMDILAGFYAQNYKHGDTARNARRALMRAADASVRSTVVGRFSAAGDRHEWPAVRGFAFQTYEGGIIRNNVYEEIAGEAHSFKKVTFQRCERLDDVGYSDCEFIGCSFRAIDPDYLSINRFEKCDFSGCEFNDSFFMTEPKEQDLRGGGNFYFSDNPPIFKSYQGWQDILIEKPPSERKKSTRS